MASTEAAAVAASSTPQATQQQQQQVAAPAAPPQVAPAPPAVPTLAPEVTQKLSEALVGILVKAGVPNDFALWLSQEDLTDVSDLALLANKEEHVGPNILEASGLPNPRPKTIVAVKRAWTMCRDAYDRKANLRKGGGTESEDKPLDEQDLLPLRTKCKKLYGHVLPLYRLVADGLFAKIFRDLASEPKKFPILSLDKLQVGNLMTTPSSSVMVFSPGRPAEVVDLAQVQVVTGHYEFFVRLRALFTSYSFATVGTDFLPMQELEGFVDMCHGLLFQQFDKSLAPLQHYSQAYLQTMQFFQTEVCTTGKTLAQAVLQTGQWRPFWTTYSVPASSNHQASSVAPASGVGTTTRFPDPNPALKAQLEKQKELIKRYQGERDRLESALARAQPSGGLGQQQQTQQGGKTKEAGVAGSPARTAVGIGVAAILTTRRKDGAESTTRANTSGCTKKSWARVPLSGGGIRSWVWQLRRLCLWGLMKPLV